MKMIIDDPMEIGKYIRQQRRRKGWSQTVLGDLSGVHWQTISNWERGEQRQDVGTLLKVLDALGLCLSCENRRNNETQN